ncbi:MAG TPA: carbohydrate ABC transporter permease [Ktedonobacteraceae bacterium]|nr:carbohydrate ABC transporter permease [Ktedonobacteraceae bacterium]
MALQQETLVRKIITHVLLLIGAVIAIFPFYWMIVMSTNTTSDIYRVPPKLIFGGNLWINIAHVLQDIDFFRAFLNTLTIACATTLLVLFFCSLAGFTFAKIDFPAKNTLFAILVGTIMLPTAGSVVALFVIMADLHLIGTLLPVILPGMAPAFGIFWMRQIALGSVSSELIDAARLDGAGHMRLYWHVALPVLRPAMGWLGLSTFIAAWNDYFWPLIVLNDPKVFTLQIALAQLNGIYNTDYSAVMAATLMATLPLLIVFFIGARQFIGNISAGALKF